MLFRSRLRLTCHHRFTSVISLVTRVTQTQPTRPFRPPCPPTPHHPNRGLPLEVNPLEIRNRNRARRPLPLPRRAIPLAIGLVNARLPNRAIPRTRAMSDRRNRASPGFRTIPTRAAAIFDANRCRPEGWNPCRRRPVASPRGPSKTTSPDEKLPDLRPPVRLAQEMGKGLAARRLLFERVQEKSLRFG